MLRNRIRADVAEKLAARLHSLRSEDGYWDQASKRASRNSDVKGPDGTSHEGL